MLLASLKSKVVLISKVGETEESRKTKGSGGKHSVLCTLVRQWCGYLHLSGEDNVRKKAILDDSDLEACLSSWNLVLENPRHLHEKMMPVSLLTPKTGLGKSSTFCDEQALFLMHEKDSE